MDDRDSSCSVVSFGPFRLFAAERQLKKGDEPLPLGGRALDALIALVERAGEVVTQRELISRVWPDVTVEEANFRVHIATFAGDALVNDQLRDYWGKPAIREWAARDIIGESLTMDVTTVVEHYGNCILTANVVGKFDMRGLPDPLVLAFYFTAHDDQIVQLIILRNRNDV
jgi:hypothetical protein